MKNLGPDWESKFHKVDEIMTESIFHEPIRAMERSAAFQIQFAKDSVAKVSEHFEKARWLLNKQIFSVDRVCGARLIPDAYQTFNKTYHGILHCVYKETMFFEANVLHSMSVSTSAVTEILKNVVAGLSLCCNNSTCVIPVYDNSTNCTDNLCKFDACVQYQFYQQQDLQNLTSKLKGLVDLYDASLAVFQADLKTCVGGEFEKFNGEFQNILGQFGFCELVPPSNVTTTSSPVNPTNSTPINNTTVNPPNNVSVTTFPASNGTSDNSTTTPSPVISSSVATVNITVNPANSTQFNNTTVNPGTTVTNNISTTAPVINSNNSTNATNPQLANATVLLMFESRKTNKKDEPGSKTKKMASGFFKDKDGKGQESKKQSERKSINPSKNKEKVRIETVPLKVVDEKRQKENSDKKSKTQTKEKPRIESVPLKVADGKEKSRKAVLASLLLDPNSTDFKTLKAKFLGWFQAAKQKAVTVIGKSDQNSTMTPDKFIELLRNESKNDAQFMRVVEAIREVLVKKIQKEGIQNLEVPEKIINLMINSKKLAAKNKKSDLMDWSKILKTERNKNNAKENQWVMEERAKRLKMKENNPKKFKTSGGAANEKVQDPYNWSSMLDKLRKEEESKTASININDKTLESSFKKNRKQIEANAKTLIDKSGSEKGKLKGGNFFNPPIPTAALRIDVGNAKGEVKIKFKKGDKKEKSIFKKGKEKLSKQLDKLLKKIKGGKEDKDKKKIRKLKRSGEMKIIMQSDKKGGNEAGTILKLNSKDKIKFKVKDGKIKINVKSKKETSKDFKIQVKILNEKDDKKSKVVLKAPAIEDTKEAKKLKKIQEKLDKLQKKKADDLAKAEKKRQEKLLKANSKKKKELEKAEKKRLKEQKKLEKKMEKAQKKYQKKLKKTIKEEPKKSENKSSWWSWF